MIRWDTADNPDWPNMWWGRVNVLTKYKISSHSNANESSTVEVRSARCSLTEISKYHFNFCRQHQITYFISCPVKHNNATRRISFASVVQPCLPPRLAFLPTDSFNYDSGSDHITVNSPRKSNGRASCLAARSVRFMAQSVSRGTWKLPLFFFLFFFPSCLLIPAAAPSQTRNPGKRHIFLSVRDTDYVCACDKKEIIGCVWPCVDLGAVLLLRHFSFFKLAVTPLPQTTPPPHPHPAKVFMYLHLSVCLWSCSWWKAWTLRMDCRCPCSCSGPVSAAKTWGNHGLTPRSEF